MHTIWNLLTFSKTFYQVSMAKDNELCVVTKKIMQSNYSNISFYVKTNHMSTVHFDGSLDIFLLKVSCMHRIREQTITERE